MCVRVCVCVCCSSRMRVRLLVCGVCVCVLLKQGCESARNLACVYARVCVFVCARERESERAQIILRVYMRVFACVLCM